MKITILTSNFFGLVLTIAGQLYKEYMYVLTLEYISCFCIGSHPFPRRRDNFHSIHQMHLGNHLFHHKIAIRECNDSWHDQDIASNHWYNFCCDKGELVHHCHRRNHCQNHISTKLEYICHFCMQILFLGHIHVLKKKVV